MSAGDDGLRGADPAALALLRQRIERGEYEIPADDVADAIISFFDRVWPDHDDDDDPDEER